MRHRRLIALTVTVLGAALALGALAQAQQPPPAWQQGRPPSRQAHRWRPSRAPPAPTPAAQIPVDKLKLPPGFKISVWADGIHNARPWRGDPGARCSWEAAWPATSTRSWTGAARAR